MQEGETLRPLVPVKKGAFGRSGLAARRQKTYLKSLAFASPLAAFLARRGMEMACAGQASTPSRHLVHSDQSASAPAGDGFMNIPDGIDEELPFN